MASSSSSESIMWDSIDGPTISPMSSSSSSTSSGTRSLRRRAPPKSSPSSEEPVENESEGLNPESGNVGDEALPGGNSDEGPAFDPWPPKVSEGHWNSVESCFSSPVSPPSTFSAACSLAASRAASCRRAREGPRLRGAGGGGRIGMGWLDACGIVVSEVKTIC
ncbi:hypothetical protein BDW66DRAFT_91344 [Aspergillus desertorum]